MIEFRALGPAQIDGPEGTEPQSVLARPKLLGLLSFLACGSTRGFHRRDSLIGLFWAELDQERARSAVRQSLYRLRGFLGESVVVTRGDDEVGLSVDGFWCDVAAFEAALDGDERETALRLYRGDLLDGLYVPDAPEFERWLDERRKQLRERASRAAWELAEIEAGRRNTVAAGQWTRHARDLAPLDERLLRRVIKLLDRLGDRSGAVREYEEFAARMASELELQPSPETRALIEGVRLRSQVSPPVTQVSDPQADVGSATPADDEISDRTSGNALADNYRIERELGAGGMAVVYLAHDARHERKVAVKIMHSELAATVGVSRFLREIKIAAKLTHPHIVPLYDSGSADGRLFYVMPYIAGESLRERLMREGQLPVHVALRIAREVAGALTHAHSFGIVHRDIKPENILLSGGHALVADFGIAHAVSEAGGNRLTKSGMFVGTPPYMSPEQGSGTDEFDGRSDIYSLGCVLYEMLAGEPPFTGPTSESIARQHLITAPRPITDLRPTVPDHVAAAISRSLAKAPADRYGVAAQFAEALESSDAVPPTRRARWRRPRVLVATAAALLAVIAVAVIAILSQDVQLDRNRVVVLPFDNRTGDSTLDLLGSMAADWITQGLQEVQVIEVVPTATSVESGPAIVGLEGLSEVSAARLASEATGAGTVVAGAFYRRGDSLEFQTQVIDAGRDRLARAMVPVTGLVADPASILDTLRGRAVVTVAAELDRRLMISRPSSPPPSLEAYRLYLEGQRTFYDFPPRMREALAYFYRAVAIDSTFTDPRFFLVFAHSNLGEQHEADSNAQLLIPFRSRFSEYQRATLDWQLAMLRGDRAAALEAARARGGQADAGVEAFRFNRPHEAIELLVPVRDWPDFGFNYFKLNTLMEAYHVVGNYRSELAEARNAREDFAERMMMLMNEVRALAALGRLDEVDRGLDESLLLPAEGFFDAATVLIRTGGELRAHGHRAASLRVAERAVDWFEARSANLTDNVGFKSGFAQALYLAERFEDARTLFEELATLMPSNLQFQGFLGVLAARRGERDQAIRISESLVGMADRYDFGRDLYWQACVAAQLNELDRAMVLLREAYARGRMFEIILHTDMDLEPLHGYPPYEEFIKPQG
jgi:serine/threonine protein kinase/DNA-binding SARP family transcriptional activator/tetratricopeptide (TPR) repeat protein